MERKTLEQFQDERAQSRQLISNCNYRSFEHLEALSSSNAVYVKLEALRLFHNQEMEYMQSEIDRLESNKLN